ncbi:hypothetical protein HID58_006266, partial [Brassica napus]
PDIYLPNPSHHYGSLAREAFLVSELIVPIDCLGIEKKDCKKIGAKLRDMYGPLIYGDIAKSRS